MYCQLYEVSGEDLGRRDFHFPAARHERRAAAADAGVHTVLFQAAA